MDCGSLPDPAFGNIIITTTKFAGAAKYSCNDGYMLMGVAIRRCMANGVWSDEAPTCSGMCGRDRVIIIHTCTPVASSCGPLSSPANGVVSISGTNIGASATYVCNRGFRLVGQSVRKCLFGARWSGTAPTCTGEVISLFLRPLLNLSLSSPF